MNAKRITDKEIELLKFQNRENGFHHHTHLEDMKQYDLVRKGDPLASVEAMKMISSGLTGRMCSDPLRNSKYLFASGAALATRACIQNGLSEETAYIISDLYIQKMDHCRTKESVIKTYGELFDCLSAKMQCLHHHKVYSQPVARSINYIVHNLHQPLHIRDIAAAIHLNTSYLSALFKKETGHTLSEYILNQKISSAKNLLCYSEYSCLEISQYLSFSSQSHFSSIFKKITGFTPLQYRKKSRTDSFL